MQEWSVRVQARPPRMPDADAVMDGLATYAPALSMRGDELSVRLSVSAPTPEDAVRAGIGALRAILPELAPVAVEAQTAEELDRLLETEPAAAVY